VFSNPGWKDLAQQIAKKHFEKENAMDDVVSLEILADEKSAFSFFIVDKGFMVDGFTSHAARAIDGVVMQWDIFSKFLTPRGKQLAQVQAPK
ncbi:MAG: hypothetical protein EB003_13425, partial [Flavobacteriia bacterium]|nr:hypothetical protein [Flavobacteriia bacterium]